MLNRDNIVFRLVTLFVLLWVAPVRCPGQSSNAFRTVLGDNVTLSETDFAGVDRGEPLVKLLPAQDKREVAVGGLVRVETTSETFLQSFRESMTQKNNAAVLEIGKFSNPPTIDDLQGLTIENRDIEDLGECVVGNCKLKLSALMIDRLQQEVDWGAPDYPARATHLIKRMLLDYVSDYLNRGNAALIQYSDKQKEIRVADDQRELMAASGYDSLKTMNQSLTGSCKSKFETIDSAIVWSKIKYGLKPVIAINHITIYKSAPDSGTPVLIVSRQIYANHYLDSSLALTAFLTVHGETPESYLFYENRSRLDGLNGLFGKLKRGMVEDRAVASLESILRQSQLSLQQRSLKVNDASITQSASAPNWRRWRLGRLRVLLLLIGVSGLVFFLGVRAYGRKSLSRELHLRWKPNVHL